MKQLFTITSFLSLLFFPLTAEGATILPVPFTSQAPFGIWVEPWENACEESSIAMVNAFYQKKVLTPTVARQDILHVLSIKQKTFGWSLDENAATMTTLINDFFPWEARIAENPTLEEIKAELDAGHPIILPVYGKALKNPYFRFGGPTYHVLVISGYDDEKKEFITREPGTRRGLDFRYSYATILAANHDFVPHGKTQSGKRVMIFTSPDLVTSHGSDADRDGLTKAQELAYKTSLTERDTDKDGFADGVEVQNGYSPVKK